MLGAEGPSTKEAEVEKEHRLREVADLAEQVTSSELHPRIAEAMRKMQEAMYPVCSLHNIDFGEHVKEYELTHEVFLLESMNLFCRD